MAEDESVKPSMSNTLEIGKLPRFHDTVEIGILDKKIHSDTTGGSTGFFKHCKAWLQEWNPSFSTSKGFNQAGIYDSGEYHYYKLPLHLRDGKQVMPQ